MYIKKLVKRETNTLTFQKIKVKIMKDNIFFIYQVICIESIGFNTWKLTIILKVIKYRIYSNIKWFVLKTYDFQFLQNSL